MNLLKKPFSFCVTVPLSSAIRWVRLARGLLRGDTSLQAVVRQESQSLAAQSPDASPSDNS